MPLSALVRYFFPSRLIFPLDKNNYPLYPVVPGGEKQREIAYRFGINLSMYALTGNYKSDQVHSKSILNRLR